MTNQAFSTLPREAKGVLAPPPQLGGRVQAVADAIAAWPEVEATTHWHLCDRDRVDGIDFYVGSDELGHIHLDGSIHLATRLDLGLCWWLRDSGDPSPGQLDGRWPPSIGWASMLPWRSSAATTIGYGPRPVHFVTRADAGENASYYFYPLSNASHFL